ncbi:MAG: FAD:protein FMN transferase [Hespellia sp.]|nr:FAD:protein FMN transferase [Hespellia sp.]
MKHLSYSKIILSFFLFLILAGCAARTTPEPDSVTEFCLDTVITIKVWGNDNPDLLTNCVKMCREYENKLSRTKEGSEIYQINHANGQPVTVSDDTAELIRAALHYGKISDGKFDITIAPLSILWDFKNNTGVLPQQKDIDEARSHVDYSNVSVSENIVSLKDPKASIDLGGIAKGYIADQLKSYLLTQGIEHATISLGGNILTIGGRPDGSAFQIGIQKPFDEQNSVITSLEIQDQSVVTSGIYERYFEIDDQIYHHILDPKTGWPYENGLLSVTIVSDDSVDGDALSTACFAMGLEDGLAYVNSQKDIEALFITEDYELHYSEGLTP